MRGIYRSVILPLQIVRPVFTVAALLGWIAGIETPAYAANFYWAAAADGVFSVPGNWTGGGGPPDADDNAYFTAVGAQHTVSFDGSVTNVRVLSWNSHVNFNLGGHDYLLSHVSDSYLPHIGLNTATQPGTAVFSNGTFKTSGLNVTGAAGAPGCMTLTGPGMYWQHVDPVLPATMQYITVGRDAGGLGRVELLAGAQANLKSVYIGYNAGATGELSVAGAGTVLSNGTIVIGYGNPAQGTVILDDGAEWYSDSAYVGYNGMGEVLIRDGAVWCPGANTMNIGYNSSGIGTVTVAGANARLLCSNTLVVGQSGRGALVVSNGGFAQLMALNVGNLEGSAGLFTAAGPGTIVTNSMVVTLGNLGEGHVRIDDGAEWRLPDRWIWGAFTNTASGSLTVAGGATVKALRIYLCERTGSPGASGGSFLFAVTNQGEVVLDQFLHAWEGATVRIDGGTITAGALDFRTNCVFEVRLHTGGTNALVDIATNAALGGATFNLAVADDFRGDSDQVFTIIDAAGTLSGNFAGLPDNTEIKAGRHKFRLNYDLVEDAVKLTHICPAGTIFSVR